MKKIYILTLLLCFISFGNSFAQTLKGHIYDANTNEPLVGAAVTYKLHGNQGTVSDINGAYEIKLPEGGVDLVFSYIGYEDVLMPIVIGKREVITKDVYMKESTKLLEEVVVSAGRFEQKLSNVTVSMDLVKAGDIAVLVLLTKADKLASGARKAQVNMVREAVLAFNESFTSARSGQTDAPEGYTHYLLKFDGVEEHRKESQTFGDPKGFGALEYVYYLMARQCGISMMPCHLLPEGHRRHFITQRFDRRGNAKVHVQTLCAMAHASFKQVGRYSYEEVLQTMRQMRLPVADAMELLRRVVFNVIARNHDDHTKNFSFMMDPESNAWSLAPAYDVAYSYKPGSHWVDQHAMSLNGKRDNFTRADLLSLVNTSSSTALKRGMRDAIDRTLEVVSNFTALAREHEVPDSIIDMVALNLRLKL